MEKTVQRFEAISRICLNNWHYIDRKILTFNEGINFFTGHSGSGKSTVIDALQILLYANTDGRSFFNKAAADDSDRTLIEYLRGMINIGENNESSYLRNHNFSTTIVMELKRTDTNEYQSIGAVFDIESATNEVSRMLFWHHGSLLESHYRVKNRTMAIDEMKDYLQTNYSKEQYYIGTSNERFRKQLYDIYLGGLNKDRFPLLFKRAIPFKMNIKLEDFVKEYICMEEDIQIEDMQESVMQYGRMRKKIGDTRMEIEELEEIETSYLFIEEKEEEQKSFTYFMNSMEIRNLQEQISELQIRIEQYKGDYKKQQENKIHIEEEIEKLEEESRELDRRIAASGYEELMSGIKSMEYLQEQNVNGWKQEQKETLLKCKEKQKFRDGLITSMENTKISIETCDQDYLRQNEILLEKEFENNLQTVILTIARRYCPEVDDNMNDSQVLSQLYIEEYSQALYIKGNLAIKIEEKLIDLSEFKYGVALNSQTLKNASIVEKQRINKVVTIENKANFESVDYEDGTLYIFSHGYFSPKECEFLSRLHNVLEEQRVGFFHSGDLDFGGVRIFQYIRTKIFPEVLPLHMEKELLIQYKEAGYGEAIPKQTLEKLKKVKEPLLQALINEILLSGWGIEQECFL